MSQNIEQFGKYLLLERLAAGGMAEVYLAKSTGAGGVNKFLAIKRILPQFSDNPEFIEMFKEEAKIAVNLNHGNVVSIYDFGIQKGQFFIVMEYVEGKNLRQIINELKKASLQLSIENISYIVKEVAAGLDHAHRCIDGSTGKPLNITHRDMSPQNVMVSYEGEVKVIDFGIAKAETQMEATRAGTLKGKFGYMSPEQADGQPIDLRTDIFSLGIVLWELLANERLFSGTNEAAILRKIKECQIPRISKLNPSVPPELERIVNKALAKDRSLRYQNSASLHRDLNKFLNTQYPDFSPQDFSVFVKNAFATQFSDIKRKLVEYSRLQSVNEEKTLVTKTMGASTITQNENPSEAEDLLNINPESKIQVNLNEFKKESKASNSKYPNAKGTNTGTYPSAMPTRTGINQQGSLAGTRPSFPNPNTQQTTFRPSNVDNTSNWLMRIIIFVIVGGVGWIGYNKFASKNRHQDSDVMGAQDSNQQSAKNLIPPPPVQTDFTSKVQYDVSLQTDPPGALIYIDGNDIAKYTPQIVKVEGNKQHIFRFAMQGYDSSEVTRAISTNNETIRTKLVLAPKKAYINLKIENGGANPVVKIDGVVTDPPYENISINSKVPVKIVVTNPFLRLEAEQTVTVDPSTKKDIVLVLHQKIEKSNK